MLLHWLPAGSFFNRLQGQVSNGVHLFFVLSGFLITRILMQCRANVEQKTATRAHSFRQFYIRRFLRIFPVYYFVLIAGALLNFDDVRHAFFWHASYLSNVYYYHRNLTQPFVGPASLFWSLAVEEQFYLVWPLAILFLPRRAIFPFVAIVAVAGTAVRVDALLTDSWLRILPQACMNFLAMGSLVAVAESPVTGSPTLRRRLFQTFGVLIGILACSAVAVVLKLGVHHAMESVLIKAINQPMMSMIYACLFSWAATGVQGPVGHILRFRPLVYLGRISYGLYVYHLFVSFGLWRIENWLGHFIHKNHAAQLVNNFGVRFTITVAIASASWFLLEKPLNDLKRFFPISKPNQKPPSRSLRYPEEPDRTYEKSASSAYLRDRLALINNYKIALHPEDRAHPFTQQRVRRQNGQRQQHHRPDAQRAGNVGAVTEALEQFVDAASDGPVLLLLSEDQRVTDFEHCKCKRQQSTGHQIRADERHGDPTERQPARGAQIPRH